MDDVKIKLKMKKVPVKYRKYELQNEKENVLL